MLMLMIRLEPKKNPRRKRNKTESAPMTTKIELQKELFQVFWAALCVICAKRMLTTQIWSATKKNNAGSPFTRHVRKKQVRETIGKNECGIGVRVKIAWFAVKSFEMANLVLTTPVCHVLHMCISSVLQKMTTTATCAFAHIGLRKLAKSEVHINISI